MFRRCISFLVMVGFFASQLASVPHAHAGSSAEERQKHDATPHFHVEWFCGDDAHGESCDHGEHSHSHDGQHPDKPVQSPFSDSEDQPHSDGLNCIAHDTNAIFAPSQVVAISIPAHNDTKAVAEQFAAVNLLTEIRSDIWPSLPCKQPLHPPDAVQDGSDTYLTLRNLRI